MTYEYDYRNLLVRLIRAGGRTGEPGSYTYDFSKITSYTYTADGRISTTTDRNGAVTVCVYDIHGNLLSKIVTEGAVSQSISYTYDHNRNVLTMTDGTGTTTRTYDAWNRTTTKTVPDIGTSFYTYDITDGFDAGCSAESTVDPKGNVTVKVYDRVGRLIYVLADSMTTSYAYYDDGSLQSVAYGNGSREDYTYTADKLLKTLVNKAIDGTIIDSYEYTYDAAHNLLSKTDSKGVTAYTYDAQNRILTVTEPSGKTTVYTYDAAGNRASQTETEGTDVTATTYTYDALNRLVQTSERLNGTLSRTVDYAYDNNGNLLTVTSVTYTDGTAGSPVLEQSNTYDLTNQLIRTVTSDGTTVENTYNGDGLRVVKSVNGSLTRFLYQYDKIVLELNALGDQTGRNVYGLNLISRTFGEDTFFYFYNGHADVTALLASDGTIAATYYYDAFGNILDQTGTATSNILYAGYQYDPETGLYYLNARMYDPVTARFIQEDSYLGSRNDALSLNLYTYCKNSPIRYSDPTGHNTQEDYKYQQDMRARRMKSSTLDAYEYQIKTQNTADRQHKWETMEQKGTAQIEKISNACKPQSNFPNSVLSNLQSFGNSCQSAMFGYGTALVKDLVVSPLLMNGALLASIASPGATPGDKIVNSFGQYSKNMEVIDNFEQSITSGIVKDKKAYYGGKIAGDSVSMMVSAVEIDTGVSLAAGGALVDVVSAVGSETGVGAVALAGSLAVTAEGAVVAEWGLTTAASSMIYFAKDLEDFQSSGTEGTGKTNHGNQRANERGFSDEKINDIINNYSQKVYQSEGRTVYAKKNGNYYDVIIYNREGEIITTVGGNTKSLKTWSDVLKMLNNNGGCSSLPVD